MTADDWAVVANEEVLKRDEDFNGRHYTSIKFPIVQDDRTLLAGYSIDNTERRALEDKLQQHATTDGLTGLLNHRTFMARLDEVLAQAERYGRRAALVLCDIDHFKSVNDTYGHPVGDVVLRGVAQTLAREARNTDLVARYGGEEFAILMPETDAAGALVVVALASAE